MSANNLQFMSAFSDLIATPSVSSNDPSFDQSNMPVIHMLANWFEDLGFRIEIMPVSNWPEKSNLIACLGEGEGGLVLSGHTDTVPCNENAWSQDPFVLTERDQKLYGLGAADMKCFFPLIMNALQVLDQNKFKQPLYILGTADEESSMAGALALMRSGKKLGNYALIGEPTNLKPVNMHKGILLEKIRVTGRAGHSSNPSLGNSALEGMHGIIGALIAWREQLQQTCSNQSFRVPVPTLNFGSIHGGDNPNRICAECELSIDIRLLPEMDLQQTKEQMHDVVEQAIDGSGLQVEFYSIFNGIAGMHTDKNTEIIRLAEKLSGHSAGTVAFATEGPYFNALGMDTVVLGPGDIDHAHQADEFIAMNTLQPMTEILKETITHFCFKDTGNAK